LPEFEWDEHNIAHIALHGVSIEDAEGGLSDDGIVPIDAYWRNDEWRVEVLGSTYGGRVLDIVFTRRGERVRVVTARDANRKERRLYSSRNR
jgi:uncharacterized DUF497 family protein